MDREVRDVWLKDLRSGEYTQTHKSYLGIEDKATDTKVYCCLGVLVDNAAKDYAARHWEVPNWDETQANRILYDDSNSAYLQRETLKKIGLSDEDQSTLAGMNDGGTSFDEIAIWIETNL